MSFCCQGSLFLIATKIAINSLIHGVFMYRIWPSYTFKWLLRYWPILLILHNLFPTFWCHTFWNLTEQFINDIRSLHSNFHQFNNTAFQISADLAFNFYTHFLFQVQPGAIFQSHFPDFAFKICLYRFNPKWLHWIFFSFRAILAPKP